MVKAGWVNPWISGSSGKDNGAIGTILRLHQGKNTHATTAQLVNNLARGEDVGRSTLYIAGHGSPGYFETGAGQWGGEPEDSVELATEYVWGEQFAKLKAEEGYLDYEDRPRAGLYLISCSVLQTPTGIKLAKRLSEITNRTVYGYPGLVYVGDHGVTYEHGRFPMRIVADKFAQRIPNPEPSRPAWPMQLLRGDIEIEQMGFGHGKEARDVASIELTARVDGAPATRVLPPDASPILFADLFFGRPFEKHGTCLGVKTAEITIRYMSSPPSQLVVYADGIAEEADSTRCFLTSASFRNTVEMLMK